MDTKDKLGTIPVGIVLYKDEPEEVIFAKFIAWLTLMILFVLILMSVTGYFSPGRCKGNFESLPRKRNKMQI